MTSSQLNLPHGNKQKGNGENKEKTEMLRRNGPVIKSLDLKRVYGGKDL